MKRKKRATKLFAMLLAVSLLLTFGLLAYADEDPSVTSEETEETITATVTLEAGETFIFTVSEDGTVILVEAASEEGSDLLETLDLEGLSLEECIQAILDTFEDAPVPEITVFSSSEELMLSLTESLDELFGEVTEAVLEDEEDDEMPDFIRERFELAKEYEITPGKMNLLQKLSASTQEELDLSLWKDSSVKDIMKAIKENKKAGKEQETETLEDTQENTGGKTKSNNGKAKGKNK